MSHSKSSLAEAIASQLADFSASDTLEVKSISEAIHALALEKGPDAATASAEELLREELNTLEWPPRLGAALIRAVLKEVNTPRASFLDAACIYMSYFHELDATIARCHGLLARNGPGDVEAAAELLRRAVDSLREC